MNLLLGFLSEMGLAAVPAVGFALVFTVPVRALAYCAVFGAIGRGSRYLMMQGGMPIEWATLIAAGLVSFIGVYIAQRLRAHPKIFTVAAMIPMIPGVSFFTTILALAEMQQKGYTPELLGTAVSSGIKTLFIVNGLAVGLALPGLLYYRNRPVV